MASGPARTWIEQSAQQCGALRLVATNWCTAQAGSTTTIQRIHWMVDVWGNIHTYIKVGNNDRNWKTFEQSGGKVNLKLNFIARTQRTLDLPFTNKAHHVEEVRLGSKCGCIIKTLKLQPLRILFLHKFSGTSTEFNDNNYRDIEDSVELLRAFMSNYGYGAVVHHPSLMWLFIAQRTCDKSILLQLFNSQFDESFMRRCYT